MNTSSNKDNKGPAKFDALVPTEAVIQNFESQAKRIEEDAAREAERLRKLQAETVARRHPFTVLLQERSLVLASIERCKRFVEKHERSRAALLDGVESLVRREEDVAVNWEHFTPLLAAAALADIAKQWIPREQENLASLERELRTLASELGLEAELPAELRS